jgi:hypothetical protein
MCRNIRKQRQPGRKPTEDELEAAARQFVRKVTGYPKPSRANQEAFERAIAGIATITQELFDELVIRG